MIEMKDMLGKDLSIGDNVTYTCYGDETMRFGVIERETSKTLFIKHGKQVYSNARIAKRTGHSNRLIKI